MGTRAGRLTLIIIGIVAIVFGALFAGQGANLIPGSSMTGDPTWLFIGLGLVVVGIVLVVLGVRRRKGSL
ncbi:LPXTG cell wall anchor domain-containing protein [Herbiconiux sp. A18JL235]|uniref:LPXTG cell wall anchor domain-containing protein n=1 Tax=Herbiconiux sp. A18JL235 TaxID=3152363 RepID=A0AB39BE19_9MICO